MIVFTGQRGEGRFDDDQLAIPHGTRFAARVRTSWSKTAHPEPTTTAEQPGISMRPSNLDPIRRPERT
jgi:hypothetical protein